MMSSAPQGHRGRDLERFLVRIVFHLFADDTGIFEAHDIFSDFLDGRAAFGAYVDRAGSHRRPDGRHVAASPSCPLGDGGAPGTPDSVSAT